MVLTGFFESILTGHTFVGIEFSRYSRISRKWERYNLRFGFVYQGGMSSLAESIITAHHQATIPAQLLNEKDRAYDISRSYPVNNRQVNAVLRASQIYPDKGYNSYTRNCTTFAKEMSLIAGVPGAETIFRQEEIEYTQKANRELFGGSMLSHQAKAKFGENLTKLTHGDDLNYQGFGNKRATKEDYDNYRNSMSYFKGPATKTDLPNAVAENLRRDRRWKTGGVIGSFIDNKYMIEEARGILKDLGPSLLETLEEITPDGKLNDRVPSELSRILEMLGHPEDLLGDGQEKMYSENELKEMRVGMTNMIRDLNLLLFKY